MMTTAITADDERYISAVQKHKYDAPIAIEISTMMSLYTRRTVRATIQPQKAPQRMPNSSI